MSSSLNFIFKDPFICRCCPCSPSYDTDMQKILTSTKSYVDTADHTKTFCCSSHTWCSLPAPLPLVSVNNAPAGVWYASHVLKLKSKHLIKETTTKTKERLQQSLYDHSQLLLTAGLWWMCYRSCFGQNVSRSYAQPLVKCPWASRGL